MSGNATPSEKTTGEKLVCPAPNCHKCFKSEGWRRRHVKTCHPNLPTPYGTGEAQEASTSKPQEINLHKCPVEGCDKQLPTWKGIVNHCYVKHGFSAITNTYKGPGLKKPKTAMCAP